MVDLATFNPEARYVIFDDFDWEYMPNKKSWFGAQREFTVTDKYRKKMTIRWGKPLIYLTNDELTLNDWFRDNCIRVQLWVPMYT